MKTPLVSVIMPAKNCARWISSAVRSVLEQTYRHVELLIGDNGSEDGTPSILAGLAADPRMRMFSFGAEVVGAGAIRNALVEQARGAYVMPCDADDLMLPWNIEDKVEALVVSHGCDAIIYGDIIQIREDRHGKPIDAPDILGTSNESVWLVTSNCVNHGGSLISREMFLKVGGYEQGLQTGVEDRVLIIRLDGVGRIRYLPGRPGYVWRRHPQQATASLHDVHSQETYARAVTSAMAARRIARDSNSK